MIAALSASSGAIAAVSLLVSGVLGYLGYKRSVRADRLAAQAGIATLQHGTVGQVIDGLNQLVDALQADNLVGRGINADCLSEVERLKGLLDGER